MVTAGTPEEAPVNGWRKSTRSFANGNCAEVAARNGTVAVRDTTDRSGPALRFTPDEWHAFIGGVRNGEFDRFGRSAG